MTSFNENTVEMAALSWFAEVGFHTISGPTIAPEAPGAERASYEQVYLYDRVRSAARRLNQEDPSLVDEALKRLERATSQSEIEENARVHELIVHGIPIEHRAPDGSLRTTRIQVVDWSHGQSNDWLAVNQFSVTYHGRTRRPDIVIFLNGIPVALLELKNSANEGATLKSAWNQIQTYRNDIPQAFTPNALVVISDGISAALGAFTAPFEHYSPWKTIDGSAVVSDRAALEVLIKGVFEPSRLLDVVQNFISFSDEGDGVVKRIAKYHQYWAVNAAIESTVRAAQPSGDRRGGVVWHTQGSGKSVEMLLYAAKMMRDNRMSNPTLVFITDRNDLDDQLFDEVFAPARILPEAPAQASSRSDLRQKLQRASGGIIFTTLQKFATDPRDDTELVLTDRRNVVVVADEAHRSQYGFVERLAPDGTIRGGLAKSMRDALPGATYLGFTGTPIESADKSTRAVFGTYIDVYDLTRAVQDGATVKIFYESRLAQVSLASDDRDALDALADEITEQVEEDEASKAKTRWARLEAIVGADERLDRIAQDIVEHWDKRRKSILGKGMVVSMSRRIAVSLYDKIVALRPEWHNSDPSLGKIKVIMTGSASDPAEFQPHIYNKEVRRDIKARAKDLNDPLELVIVRDMWLTGFDSPVMHTMYVDKTMQGAGLMQAIARVNRTFRDKPGGLIVDFIGVFANLQKALVEYSPSDRDQAGVPIEDMIDVMLEKHDVITGILHGCSYNSSPTLQPAQRLSEHAKVLDFVMSDPDRVERFLDQVLALAKAYAICAARDEADAIRNDVRLFTDVRAAILKIQNPDSGRGGAGAVDVDTAIGQLVNEAVTSDEVVDIYKLAGVETPEISTLSDEFLDSLADRDKPNLQLGLLRRLLNDQVRSIRKSNVVQARRFSELLESAINKYTNRTLTTAEIIAELVELAKDMRNQVNRHDELGLAAAEAAFYDAVAQNDAALTQMGDETLKKMASELVASVRESATIDWNLKESVRAKMRSKVRRLLAKYDYPPDLEAQAVELVLQQAELFASDDGH
ncbi:type I restriction endonuclease subunit R [Actinomycetospora sp. C-140]